MLYKPWLRAGTEDEYRRHVERVFEIASHDEDAEFVLYSLAALRSGD
jgi:hypothetical protein